MASAEAGIEPLLQLLAEAVVHHVVDDLARGVERAGLLAGGGAGFRVVGGEQVLEHLAGQLRVERDFLLDGRVFLDR